MLKKIKDIIYILKNSNYIVKATFILIIILSIMYIFGFSKANAQIDFNQVEQYIQQYIINKENSESLYEQADYTTSVERLRKVYQGTLFANKWQYIKEQVLSKNDSNTYYAFYSDSDNWIHFFTFETLPTLTMNNNNVSLTNYTRGNDYRFQNSNGNIYFNYSPNSTMVDIQNKPRQNTTWFSNVKFPTTMQNFQRTKSIRIYTLKQL